MNINREYENILNGDYVGGSGRKDIENTINEGIICLGNDCDVRKLTQTMLVVLI